ncbi:MAG: PilC/PilY family type IV pilus protein [Anaeromyxobacter sp.]
MRLRPHHLSIALLTLVVLASLPLRSDGAGECCNVTTSTASMVNNPTAGDEVFFKLPNGPTNIMFLLDTSGSMDNFVQCTDDNGWGDLSNGSKCSWPTSAELATPSNGGMKVNGTCTFNAATSALAWMYLKDSTTGMAVTSASAPDLVDPGHGTVSVYGASALTDSPAWGTGCTGNGCLFKKTGYYFDGSWTQTGATDSGDCNLKSSATSTTVVRDRNNVTVGPDATACKTCLDSKGFYFYRYTYETLDSRGRVVYNTGQRVVFAGWWMNANPPKFMTARKAIKDIAWMDPIADANNLPNMYRARMGLSLLTPDSSSRRIVVPLGPGKTDSYPVNVSAMVKARQVILDALNRVWPTGVTVPALNSGSTPLAPALAQVGQYFTNGGRYTTLLGASYELTQFVESTAGIMKASWAGTTAQCSVCWGCQNSAVVILTDGSPNTEGDTPTAMRTYAEAAYANVCGAKASGYPNCRSPSLGAATYLPRVAAWLKDTDLRTDLAVSDPQSVTTSLIGFGIKSNFDASYPTLWKILTATAALGGGKAYDATTPKDLSDQLTQAVNDVVERSNSFSAPAASSLSTIHTAASEAFITRFKPNDTAAWEGHVFQGLLFDEFLNGCDPTKTPGSQTPVKCQGKTVQPNFNGNSDKDGFNICSDVFLVDQDCDEVVEDVKTGEFLKKGAVTKTSANLIWDAGEVLSNPAKTGYRSAVTGATNSRKIWTYVNGGKVSVEPANAATLAPFMSLTKEYCVNLWPSAKLCGGTTGVTCPTTATITAAQMTTCATAVINYVRGYDVFDADNDNCGGPGVKTGCTAGTDGEERDRKNDGRAEPVFWKLGDVFHSAPVLVKPPVVETTCATGYDNQCLATLWSPGEFSAKTPQTPIEKYDDVCKKGSDAYEAYRYDHRTRDQILLVGANDGMLHAFLAGQADKTSKADSDCNHTYDRGTGEELWAFVPPDLLPRLKDLPSSHQYMVDGSPMVRDVWVDGIGKSSADGKKQRDEFRTVAVVSERAGGSQFTALDITDPANPTFLWEFPPPCSDDQKYKGQSWAEFAPRPAPIGPVRIKGGGPDPLGRGFDERWVVMINGGYDPAMSQGAAVWMVDVWTGKAVWRFTNDDFKKNLGFGVGTSMFPVPGAVALADVGDTTQAQFDNDGFFDTASWGDLGGNQFVARFHENRHGRQHRPGEQLVRGPHLRGAAPLGRPAVRHRPLRAVPDGRARLRADREGAARLLRLGQPREDDAAEAGLRRGQPALLLQGGLLVHLHDHHRRLRRLRPDQRLHLHQRPAQQRGHHHQLRRHRGLRRVQLQDDAGLHLPGHDRRQLQRHRQLRRQRRVLHRVGGG